MSALGELFIYIIYFVLAILSLAFLVLTTRGKTKNRVQAGFAALSFAFLLFSYRSCQVNNHKQNQLSQVGLYYLTAYPNCDSCIIELKENQTYEVTNHGLVIEQSNWHYEVGGDYLITWLNNDKYQLGSGKFAYHGYKFKYNTGK